MTRAYPLLVMLVWLLPVQSVTSDSTQMRARAVSETGLLTISDLEYKGAFRLPVNDFGESNMSYAEGQLAYNRDKNSLFVVGHKHQQAIAEFLIPKLSKSRDINQLNMSPAPLQNFSRVLNRFKYRPEHEIIDTIGGLLYYKGKLLVNAYEYYDAPGDNHLTTLVVNQADNLAASTVDGFYALQGRAHASGWMSPVPQSWQSELEGKWIAGSSSYMPIISRLSVGPSAFVFDPDDLGRTDPTPTTALLDFSLEYPLHSDLMIENKNDLWGHMSRAVYGFIAPGTSSYVTIGFSGGHNSGICYKCKPTGQSRDCYGYCAKDASDYHLMYWLWDVRDLVKVRQGKMQANEVKPYEYGTLKAPFQATEIGGGSYDADSNQLFLSLQSADTAQTRYGPPPIIIVYGLNINQ